ncbi:MAG: efflux RND transporter periplasmic adaptor subunit [Paramuribaculum sp.]|nr:efflux RND transporter periplasmic adaptor subunit [Paramuribaculum sp.]
MKKFFRILLWVIIGLVFIGTFVFLYLNSKEEVTQYENVTPEIATLERSTVLTGKIQPRDEINIKPQISGIISEVMVEAGDMVKEGDVIAKIKVIPEASSLSSAQSRVESAKISLEDAERKYERNKSLYEKQIISREEFETSQTSYRMAQRELETALDGFRIVKEGVSSLNASESNTLVRSTITGLVLDVPVKVGTSVIQANTFNDGTTIATVADMTNLIFKGNVDETEVGLLSPGMPMEITIGSMPDIHPTAVLEFISPKGSDASGANTFEIKAALTVDSDVNLRAGYSANGKVLLARAENVLTVPEGVIEFSGDSTFVYVLTDKEKSEYMRTPVETGMTDGLKIEIKAGIDTASVIRGLEIHN